VLSADEGWIFFLCLFLESVAMTLLACEKDGKPSRCLPMAPSAPHMDPSLTKGCETPSSQAGGDAGNSRAGAWSPAGTEELGMFYSSLRKKNQTQTLQQLVLLL